MAKWGEGDPRWIVEERPDATNVNNWHWTEKNADSWSKGKLESLFKGLRVEEPSLGVATITEIESLEGEARVNNRKSKLIFFYEWVIKLKWEGRPNGADELSTGTIHIPNMSEEHTDMADVDLEVLLEKSKGSKAQELKEMMRVGKGARVMREKLAEYVTALRNEFSKGLILPNKDNNSTAPSPTENKKSVNIKKAAFNAYNNASSASSKAGSPLQLKDCHLKETFNCSGEELYNALTQKTFLQVFFASEIKMPDVAAPGETFSFLNGNIVGEFVELVPYTKIVQKWRLKSWPQGHYSLVEISIAQAKDETQLSLSQKGIPEKELENTTQGWKGYYWIPIKRCFGYGQITF